MRPQVNTSTTLVNDANGIFEDQTRTGAGALTLNGALVSSGVAYLYGATSEVMWGQKISIEGTGNNSGITATIVGTGPGGSALTETLTLANNGTATTSNYFRTVTSITTSGTVTGNIEGGFLSANGAASREFYLDRQQLPGNTSLTAYLSGTLTVTAQYSVTVRDPQSSTNYAQNAVWQSVDGLTSVSATTSSNLAYPAVATRLLITVYTSGTATYTAIQGNPY
jgi:uncharacterized membrane protein YdcZ (DUF606 family)